MKRIKLLLFPALLFGFAALAYAGYDDGKAAYDKGDFATAYQEFRKAAEEGCAVAQSLLGAMYYLGQGVAKDDVEAAKWLRKAVKQGLRAQKTSISNTSEQALSKHNMLPAPPQTGTYAERGAEREREQLIRKSLSEGKVSIGMSMDQVEQVWGKPELERKVILISNAGRASGIEWSYSDGGSVIFLNGEVTRLKGTGTRKIGK